MSTADRYAEYVSQVQYEDLPDEVAERAKELILDSVGCALGAALTNAGKANLRFAEAIQGRTESTVIGGKLRIDRTKAAFVNSQLANLLDFDDTYDVMGPGHPGCLIVPAALAVGEAEGASGQEVITAVVAAYEVTMRLGRAIGSMLWSVAPPGFVLTSHIGPVVAASRLMGLDQTTTRRALGVVNLESGFTLSAATRAKWDIPPEMALGNLKGNFGQGAERGILAAIKAASGLTGMVGLLDADRSAWYLAGLPAAGFDHLTERLGDQHWILDMSFKPTPSCRWTHVPITAAWDALDGKTVTNDDVEKVVIKGVDRLQRYDWENMLDAQFSIPCALALAITGTTPGPDWYAGGRFRDPDIRELASKVAFERDPEAESLELTTGRMTCEVEIMLTNGQVKSAHCDHVKGAPDNPMTRDELVAKFEANACRVEAVRRREILESLLNLEKMTNVAVLMEPMGTPIGE
jgi:2-methylcitrate dehydratase PrpD